MNTNLENDDARMSNDEEMMKPQSMVINELLLPLMLEKGIQKPRIRRISRIRIAHERRQTSRKITPLSG
jgi:hypothetical protein